MTADFSDFFREDVASLGRVLLDSARTLETPFADTLKVFVDCLRNHGKLLVCGNGGSAADADHFVGELVGRFGYDRAPLPGIVLSQSLAALTAIGNDYGYEEVFDRQVRALGRPGDVLVGFSTSGNSANIVKAMASARALGIKNVVFTGAANSKCSALADITLRAPSRETPRIQEIHAMLIHSLCRGLERELFPKDLTALPAEKIIATPADLARLARALPPFKSVFTNGCFDILHPGHVQLLKQARSFGDLLILGLNTDESVRKLKGPQRPFHGFADRANVLAALSVIDYVVGFAEETPAELIKKLTPKVLVKGGDYTRETIVGADWVESHGGEVRVVPLVSGHSTTRILNHG